MTRSLGITLNALGLYGIAAVLAEVAGSAGWWEDSGGFVLLALLAVAFVAGVGFRR